MTARPERELKFIADRDTFKTAGALRLLGEASDTAARPAKSVYFDTEGLDLMRRRITLRMRRMEGRCIIGVKKGMHSDQSHFERNEVEAPSPTPELDLSLLDKETAGELRSVIGEKALAPQFGSDIRRTVKTVRLHGAEIEVAFDSGFLFAGERREPTYEIELELKSGEPIALFELGLSLIDALPLKLGVLSKAERGALLMSGEPPEPVRALRLALKRDMPTEEAIGTLFRSCLNQFLDNLPALERGDSVEAVHQMRVAIRRLRSAYGLVCRLCPSVEFDALRDESRRIGTALGEARDWDVFVESICNGSLPSFVEAPGRDKLVKAAQSRAAAAHEAVTKLANERAAARLVLSLERFIAQRGWRGGAQIDRLAWLSEPVARFAVESLDRLHRKLLQRGKGFDRLTPPERHAVRIVVKHVRYATDFFGALFHPASAAQRYAERAAALQDLLGKRNDATVALRLIKMLNFSADPETAYAAGLAAGWVARGGLGDEPALRKAWRSLRKAEPYWRDGADFRNGQAG
jgi:inorganic triphosphatase YgiF